MDCYPPGTIEAKAPWNDQPPGLGHTCGECAFISELEGSPLGLGCVCCVDESDQRYAYVEAAWDCGECHEFVKRGNAL